MGFNIFQLRNNLANFKNYLLLLLKIGYAKIFFGIPFLIDLNKRCIGIRYFVLVIVLVPGGAF